MFPLKFNLQTGTHDDAVLPELSPAQSCSGCPGWPNPGRLFVLPIHQGIRRSGNR